MESQLTASVSLSAEQQRALNKQKRALRFNNEKYFRCHPELRHMIAAFLEALIEKKPDDVPTFAREFFGDTELAHKLGYQGWTRPPTPEGDEDLVGPSDAVTGMTGDDAQDLERLLIHLFTEADEDRSGFLDHNEFRQLMLTADLGLDKADINLLLAEADEDQNGNIAYAEFVPLAVEVVQTLRLKAKVRDRIEAVKKGAESADFTFNGMTRAEMEAALEAAFTTADVSSAGSLSRAEVKQMLRAPKLGLTKKQVQMLVAHVDDRPDHSLKEVLGLIDILQEAMVAMMQRQEIGTVGEELKTALGALGATRGTPTLVAVDQLKKLLSEKYPLLSLLQINAVMSEAPKDGAGLVRWPEFLPTAAMMVRGMIDPRAVEERAAVARRANFEPVELMDGKDAQMLHEMLMQLFKEHDNDGNGTLDKDEFEGCLTSTSLGFSQSDIAMLMQMADPDESGKVTYEQFAKLAYDVLLHVARERAISAAIENEAAEKMQAVAKGRAVRNKK